MATTHEVRGLGHSRQAQGGRALHPRQGQLRRRHQPARDAAHGDPAQPVRARPHRLDRHLARRGAARAWSRSSRASCWPQHNLAWMPTLSGDTQAVLATDKVRFQGQEVAAVVAETAYIAKDALELIDVDYEPLPAVTTPQQAMADGAPLIRDEKEGQDGNHIYHWEAGDKEATDRAFAEADRVVALDTFYPRCHPAPLECCGCVADVNPATGKATIYMTSQAPHAHRTLFALVAGLPEQKIRIISPDIGGGFGNKVPIYPGYVVATAASLLIGRPVKWIEDRTGNLISTGFARDYHMHGELALKGREDGRPAASSSCRTTARSSRTPSRRSSGPGSSTSSPARTTSRPRTSQADGAYTNKAPGGVAYRCSFRVTEASYLIERLVDRRRRTSSASTRRSCGARTSSSRSSSPTRRPPASSTTRATTRGRSTWRSSSSGYEELRKEQAEAARAEGKLLGIGLASLHRGRRRRARQGVRHRRPADVRLGRAARASDRQGDPQARRQVPGPGPRDDLRPDRRRGARHPVRGRRGARRATPTTRRTGSGTYASRSTPVAGAATAVICAQAARQGHGRSRRTCSRPPRTTSSGSAGRFFVKGSPDRAETIQDIAFAAYTEPAGRAGGRARGRPLLRPAEHDVPVRHLRGRRRDRPRHRRVEGAARRRGRRLRRAHQPDDRRGPDPSAA